MQTIIRQRNTRIAQTLTALTLLAPLLAWPPASLRRERGFQSPPVLYAGTSNDNSGWVIRIEPTRQSGLIVGPIGMFPICGIATDGGHLSFHASSASGVRYDFNGRLSAAGLDGSIEGSRVDIQRQTRSQRLRLRPVSGSPALGGESGFEDAYATPDGSSGGGSVLVLLRDRDSTVALYLERDASRSRASRPSRAALVGDTLQFVWQGHEIKALVKSDTVMVNGRALGRIGSLEDVVGQLGGRCQ